MVHLLDLHVSKDGKFALVFLASWADHAGHFLKHGSLPDDEHADHETDPIFVDKPRAQNCMMESGFRFQPLIQG